ncbi:MAG: hypothetical protein MRECE_16c026 [Mycoplasmataceae bacterium CE_OT135]|nr:MAG: hypothetical protein MRECE_16c026 [Mycoplasmataceae bacterium CE_OT135]
MSEKTAPLNQENKKASPNLAPLIITSTAIFGGIIFAVLIFVKKKNKL